MKMNKKGAVTLDQVAPVVLILVTIAIFLSVGAMILDEFKTQAEADYSTSSTAYNATAEGLAGLQNLAEWQTIIAVVVAAAVVIGLIYLIRR